MDDDSVKIVWSLASVETELILQEEEGSVFRAVVNEGSLLETLQRCEKSLESSDEEHRLNLRILRYMSQNAGDLFKAYFKWKGADQE